MGASLSLGSTAHIHPASLKDNISNEYNRTHSQDLSHSSLSCVYSPLWKSLILWYIVYSTAFSLHQQSCGYCGLNNSLHLEYIRFTCPTRMQVLYIWNVWILTRYMCWCGTCLRRTRTSFYSIHSTLGKFQLTATFKWFSRRKVFMWDFWKSCISSNVALWDIGKSVPSLWSGSIVKGAYLEYMAPCKLFTGSLYTVPQER